MSIEVTREVGTEAGAVSRTEPPLPVVQILPRRPFASHFMIRGVDALLGAIAGTGLDIVEGLGGVMEKFYERMDRNYARHMKELREYYSSPNDHVSRV